MKPIIMGYSSVKEVECLIQIYNSSVNHEVDHNNQTYLLSTWVGAFKSSWNLKLLIVASVAENALS